MDEEPCSVFESSTGMVTFVRIEDEFAAVDAALSHLFAGARRDEERIRSQVDAIEAGARFVFEEYGDLTHEVLMGALDVDLPLASYVANQMSRNVSLVTCFALIERCLKIVGEHYDLKLGRAQRVRGQGNIEQMLQALEETTGERIQLSAPAENLLRTERQLRNRFAHGDWDVLDGLQGVGHRDLLDAAAEIFYEIEDAYAKSA